MGETYEQLEYTPYGELWVEHLETTIEAMPFRFTGKERDSETGLYYFGARYLNPQTGMWLSADPAMGEYIPQAPVNDDIRKQNRNLPGMGGVYNYVNLHAYHYAGNNPVKLVDPDGRSPGPYDEVHSTNINLPTSENLNRIRDQFSQTGTSESKPNKSFFQNLKSIFPNGVPLFVTSGIIISPNEQQRNAESTGALIGAGVFLSALAGSVAIPEVTFFISKNAPALAQVVDEKFISGVVAITNYCNRHSGSELLDVFIGSGIRGVNALLGT